MANEIHTQIKKAIANLNLQSALDVNAQNRINARKNAYCTLSEDILSLRQQAHTVRWNVIADLDNLLDQFVKNVQTNGMIVHTATNANEATQIILDICKKHQAKLLVKSKSMVSEEIALNPALEEAGIRVVETDLGEYIVQLRKEPPAHIITPAVHLRREDVGELFAKEFGIEVTNDVPTLTSVARQVLRENFLNADIGLTGVNFGVAESGTLCILTNEGNGRMVTTLPSVHISLMGIERIVKSFEELSLMLQLLPRSATGQKLTVYTNLINSPRKSGEPDGSQERHLVLLDNGRQNLRNTSLAEALLCIRCGACLNVCPVFREIGGHAYVSKQGVHSPYPGPIGSVISPGLFGVPKFGQLARISTLCGACKEACPVDIDLPKLLLRIRAGEPCLTKRTPPNIPIYLSSGLRLFSWIATKPPVFRLAQYIAGFISQLTYPKRKTLPLPAFTGWGYSKDIAKPVIKTFHQQWNSGEIFNSNSPPVKSSHITSQRESNKTTKISKSTQTTLIDTFAIELTALGGEFIQCTQKHLANTIQQCLMKRQIHHLFTWDKNHLPEGILDQLEYLGIKTYQNVDTCYKAGLTGCSAGIADTGSILLSSGDGKPLTASLIPEVHLVILKEQDIYPHIDQIFEKQDIKEAGTAILISGPSRTADIEMSLTIGVHGPKEVIVLCMIHDDLV